jgi:hypothetical protein
VGLGAELFAPKRRFILADSFVVALSCFVSDLIRNYSAACDQSCATLSSAARRFQASLCRERRSRAPSVVRKEADGCTCTGLRGSRSVVSLQKGRVSRLNPDGGLLFWEMRSLDGRSVSPQAWSVV